MHCWDQHERADGKIKDHYGAECRQGVWSGGSLDAELERRRNNTCFYYEYQPGMSFLAAEKLQQALSTGAERRRGYRLTHVGLWIGAVGVVATPILALVQMNGG